MEAFIFILIIIGISTLLFYLGEGWKRYLDKQYKNYFDEEKQQTRRRNKIRVQLIRLAVQTRDGRSA